MTGMRNENDGLNTVYKEIADELGIEAAKTIHNMFRGQQITFPLRFMSPEKLRERIAEEYDGSNIRELARKYDYSEKTIRRIIHKQKDPEA